LNATRIPDISAMYILIYNEYINEYINICTMYIKYVYETRGSEIEIGKTERERDTERGRERGMRKRK